MLKKRGAMKLLVTGGEGFIGSNFIFYLKQKYPRYVIYNLDTHKHQADTAFPPDEKDISFICADITDRKTVYKLFENECFDAVVNFAAETHVDRSIENPSVFISTNVIGTQTLLDACRRYGVQRFHQISTDEVYGDLPLTGDASFNEEAPLRPSNPYAASKAAADMLALSYMRTYGLPVTLSRSSNNYGPRQSTDKLIPLMLTHAIEDKPLPIYGNGLNMRDWLYVEDHCSALDCILHLGRAGEIYNIGAGCVKSNIEVVHAILSVLGKDISLIRYVKDREGHDLRYSLDFNKIQTEFGWQPSVRFQEGLQRTAEWYLAHPRLWTK